MVNCKNKQTFEIDKIDFPVKETEIVNYTTLNNDCYSYETNCNKIELQIIDSENEISGNLNYQLKEKDSNNRISKGVIEDSPLIATYTFQSEGMKSSKEIAFKIKNNQLIEGYGEQVVEGSNSKFKDVKSIQFSSTIPLYKVDCSK